MTETLPAYVPDMFIKGVWGPDSKFDSPFAYGGPECAAQSSP
jgi:hypothetical protein